ncbi:hypothetical protein QIW31_07590 [Francisellaceae bacterium CB299]
MSLERLLTEQVTNIIEPFLATYEEKLKAYDSRVNSIMELPLTPKQIALVLNYKTTTSIDRLFELGSLSNVSTNNTRMATVAEVLEYKLKERN